MHRCKIVPQILLILSLINLLLAAPVRVVLQEVHQARVDMADVPEDVILPASQSEKLSDELEERWDEYSDEPWQKRGLSSGSSPPPSVGEPPQAANQGLAPNSPPPQTGTNRIQDSVSAPSPEINKLPQSGENYPSSGESYPSDHGSTTSSENYYASDEGGPGPSKSYSDSFSKTDIIGLGSNDGSPGSSKSYPPWNRPELVSNMGGPWSSKNHPPSDGPGPNPASNEGRPGSSMNYPLSNRPGIVSTGPAVLEPFPGFNPHDWSTSSSDAEPELKKNFMSKTKNFFDKLVYKFKFWPRRPGVL
jgi:hypothetical protein